MTPGWLEPHELRVGLGCMRLAAGGLETIVAAAEAGITVFDTARAYDENEALLARALRQAGRELLLAQSSDWPFILRTGTSPEYARRRVKDHLLRFNTLHQQLKKKRVDEKWLREVEQRDNLFPEIKPEYWA